MLGKAMQIVAEPGAHGHEFVLSRDFRLGSVTQRNRNKITPNASGMWSSSRFIPSLGAVMFVLTNHSASAFIFTDTRAQKTMSDPNSINRSLSRAVTAVPCGAPAPDRNGRGPCRRDA